MRVRRIIAVLAAAMVWCGAADTVSAQAQAECSLAPTDGSVTRTVDGRDYRLSVPPGLGGDVPLLVSLHGFGSSGSQDEYFTGWTGFAAEYGFIVAYPQGRPFSQSGAWDPYTSSSPDVAFLKRVVADISATWCVDADRVHVDGWSNGAVMSQRVACEAADVFASASSYAGGSPAPGGPAKPCTPSRPISVAMFAGQYDFTYPSLASNASEWRARNSCGASAVSASDAFGSTQTWSCAAGTQVVSRVVKNTSHNWPSGAQGEDQRERLWAFFEANPRP